MKKPIIKFSSLDFDNYRKLTRIELLMLHLTKKYNKIFWVIFFIFMFSYIILLPTALYLWIHRHPGIIMTVILSSWCIGCDIIMNKCDSRYHFGNMQNYCSECEFNPKLKATYTITDGCGEYETIYKCEYCNNEFKN